MKKTVTATFQIFEPITLTVDNDERGQVDEVVEMFFANGALTVSVKNA